jgi:hypothetical protein
LSALGELAAIYPDSGLVNVVIDTPRCSRCKYKYDEKKGLFRLSKLLPLGASFPYDFGFIPLTRGDDGDHFFVSYNEMEGRRFQPTGRQGPDDAYRLLEQGQRRAEEDEE